MKEIPGEVARPAAPIEGRERGDDQETRGRVSREGQYREPEVVAGREAADLPRAEAGDVGDGGGLAPIARRGVVRAEGPEDQPAVALRQREREDLAGLEVAIEPGPQGGSEVRPGAGGRAVSPQMVASR